MGLPINPLFRPTPFNAEMAVKDYPAGRLLHLSFTTPSTVFEIVFDAEGYEQFMRDLEKHRAPLKSGIVMTPPPQGIITPNGHRFGSKG